MFYKCFRHLYAILSQWKNIIKTIKDPCTNIVYLPHHLVKNNRIFALEILPSKEMYSLIISQNTTTLISQQHFETLFPQLNLDLELIYLQPTILAKNFFKRFPTIKFWTTRWIWVISFFSLGLEQILWDRVVISMMKLYNIFSALATKLSQYGQKSNFNL